MLRTVRHAMVVAAAALIGTAMVGCGSDGTDAGVRTTAAAGAATSALSFRAPLLGGGEFDGAAQAGTTVAFWFWAPT